MRARFRIAIVLCLVSATGVLFVPRAGAYVYWANGATGDIGRVADDGTHFEPNFVTGQAGPFAVAVDSEHIYWANAIGHSIGRATLDGGSVRPEFVKLPYEPNGVAVDSKYVYWSSGSPIRIGRASLNEATFEPEFVTAIDSPCGLAVDSGHIYWASGHIGPGFVGRVPLSGTPPQNEFVQVSQTDFLCGVAVSPSSVFWTDSGAGAGTNIGRAGLNNPGEADLSYFGAASGPCGITVLGSKLYWANSGTATIARANTDATDVEYEWVKTGAEPRTICGIAADSLTPPPEQPKGGGGNGGGADATPPTVKLKSGPGKKLAKGKAKFAFSSSEPGSTFSCKLDRKKPAACRSPKSYSGLEPGRHSFSVWATDAAGNRSAKPAKRGFRVPAAG